MEKRFSTTLNSLRAAAGLTNAALANRAQVPESLISGLQNGNRRVGEYQARKIGSALNLKGEQLNSFIYAAINTCTEKVLNELKPYPAMLLNHSVMQIKRAGIDADSIRDVNIVGDTHEQEIRMLLTTGKQVELRTQLIHL